MVKSDSDFSLSGEPPAQPLPGNGGLIRAVNKSDSGSDETQDLDLLAAAELGMHGVVPALPSHNGQSASGRSLREGLGGSLFLNPAFSNSARFREKLQSAVVEPPTAPSEVVASVAPPAAVTRRDPDLSSQSMAAADVLRSAISNLEELAQAEQHRNGPDAGSSPGWQLQLSPSERGSNVPGSDSPSVADGSDQDEESQAPRANTTRVGEGRRRSILLEPPSLSSGSGSEPEVQP